MHYPLDVLTALLVMATSALGQQEKPIQASGPRLFSGDLTNRASELRRLEMQILERKDLPGGLVREKLRLPGFDPDESVPAIVIHPTGGGPFPVAICLHSFRGAKENLESWCRDLAPRGIFAVTFDAHLHGERSVAGVFHGDNISSLGQEYSIWVHQIAIARTVKDVSLRETRGAKSRIGIRIGAETRDIRCEDNLIEGFAVPISDGRKG